jgi:hypothetical protein
MNHTCTVCGATWSQAVTDAIALGIQPALLRSTYACCQTTEWALEQQLAWAEARQEKCSAVEEEEEQGVLVPVRLRQQSIWKRRSARKIC